jgi:transposase
MARPYSNDLRERVAAATATGRSCREVSRLFDVSVASVVKWSQRQRATGSAAARSMGGHRKRLLEPHRALVIERLKAVPDLTLKALVAASWPSAGSRPARYRCGGWCARRG